MIRVTTKDRGCYVREKSSFHVNMNGLNLNVNEKEKTFVKMEQLVMPEKVKKLNFIMNFGYDTKFLKREDTHEYEIKYVSLNDLCHQVNTLVYNNFITKTGCIENVNSGSNDVPLNANATKENATIENPVDENVNENAGADSDGNADVAEGTVVIDGNTDVAESPVVITGPPPVKRKDNGNVNKVDPNFVKYSLRQKMSATNSVVPVENMFCLKYVDGRVQLKMAAGFMFFASAHLMLALGFRSEVMRTFTSSGKTEAEVIKESDNLTLKICSCFNISDIVHFYADEDRICHIGFKKLIEPTFFVDGNMHSILCSYDIEKKVVLCNLKRLNNVSFREVQFCLYNNLFEPYELGVCVKKCPISFNLVICKKL